MLPKQFSAYRDREVFDQIDNQMKDLESEMTHSGSADSPLWIVAEWV